MQKKVKARELDIDKYFKLLRQNLVMAEAALMQFATVRQYLGNREVLGDELRLNLEVQEIALMDMIVLCLGRLFDKRTQKDDQVSIPNMLSSNFIALNSDLRGRVSKLQSAVVVKKICKVRNEDVAHSLSHASDETFVAIEAKRIIDDCYSLLSDIYTYNRPAGSLIRNDITPYWIKWKEMTQDWRQAEAE